MSINEIIVLMMIFLSLNSFIEMCMQALKFVIEDYFKIDNETRGIKVKMCWFFGMVFAASALIATLALNVQLPISFPVLALVAIIIIDFTVCCANLRIWFVRLNKEETL